METKNIYKELERVTFDGRVMTPATTLYDPFDFTGIVVNNHGHRE